MDLHLGYVIFYVPDVEDALSFYKKAFGLETKFRHPSGDYGELETGATTLAVAKEDFIEQAVGEIRKTRPTSLPPSVEIGLVTDDPTTAFQTAVDAGAFPVRQPEEKPWGQTVAYVRDLNGYLVEICSPL